MPTCPVPFSLLAWIRISPNRGVYRELTGEAQYMHRLAASGMSERHSGHFFTSGGLGGGRFFFFQPVHHLDRHEQGKGDDNKINRRVDEETVVQCRRLPRPWPPGQSFLRSPLSSAFPVSRAGNDRTPCRYYGSATCRPGEPGSIPHPDQANRPAASL